VHGDTQEVLGGLGGQHDVPSSDSAHPTEESGTGCQQLCSRSSLPTLTTPYRRRCGSCGGLFAIATEVEAQDKHPDIGSSAPNVALSEGAVIGMIGRCRVAAR
jgi:hypothetical protein